MHDSFEKEVQKKMEELNLTPSAPVWEKIELEIRPEKKRRRAIFWLFFGLLLLSGGFFTYDLWQPARQAVDPVATPKSSANTTAPTTTTPSEENKNPLSTKQNKEKISGTVDAPSDLNPPSTNKKQIAVTVQNKKAFKREITGDRITVSTYHPSKKNESKAILQQPVNTITTDKQTDRNEAVKVPGEISLLKNNPLTVADTVAVVPNTILKDTVTQPQETKLPEPTSADTAAKKKIAANSKWKKKINMAVGKSGYGSISILNGYALNDANASPSPATGVGNGIIGRPSDVKNGLAYSVGFALARKLNEQIEVSFGLQYTHYSTTINVGSNRRTDTVFQSSMGSFAASRYYTNTNANNKYVNRFHTLEVPVTVSYKPVLKWPVLVSVGASYGRLLSTNALTYSSNSNLYYQDKENYVRQMLPLFSSIEAELFGKKKTSFRIGPFLQYNLLKIKKENKGNAEHLVFAGVKSSIIF